MEQPHRHQTLIAKNTDNKLCLTWGAKKRKKINKSILEINVKCTYINNYFEAQKTRRYKC